MGYLSLLIIGLLAGYANSFAPSIGRFFKSNVLNMVVSRNVDMPALSSTMTEGKIVSWNKKVGDKVSAGDVLLIVESDKADMDVEAFEDGYLAAIYTPEGESAAVGAAVAILVDSFADIANIGSAKAPVNPAVVVVAVAPASEIIAIPAPATASAPQFEQVTMPALSSTMTEGKVVSWSKKIGDKITSGDMVLIVESDKADMDVESYEEGFLAAILVGEGESAPVGSPVGLMAKTLAEIPAVQKYAEAMKSGSPIAALTVAVVMEAVISPKEAFIPVAAPVIVNDGRVASSGYAKTVAKDQNIDLRTVTPSRADGLITAKDLATGSIATIATIAASNEYVPPAGTVNASPMARKLALENNLDLKNIKGTGNFGRVMPDDVLIAAGKKAPVVVQAAAPAAPIPIATPVAPKASAIAPAPILEGVVAMDGMQKAVAKNMEKTLNVPIFRVSKEIVTDEFDALYAKLKPKGVTVSAMLAKAVAEVLKKHPIINAAYVEGGIKYNKDVNVAMAVSIDGGLITPTIVKANELDLFSISRNWKELVEKAKSKKLTPAEYSSGTFAITNLGMFGVSQFDAILPPGTGSILAIAASTPKVVQLKSGHFSVQKSMTVTITCDHRHIYGAAAAEFLKDLADLIENNTQSLLMG